MAPQETEQDRVEPRGLSECSQYARRDHRLLTGSRLGQLNGCDRRIAERPLPGDGPSPQLTLSGRWQGPLLGVLVYR